MMCYRDMTFCSEETCKKFSTCFRAFDAEQKAKAKRWWGGDDAPVCFYAERPKCYEEKKDEE